MPFHEKVPRSVVKSLTFRALILASDGIIVMLITHSYGVTLGVVIATNLASTVLYFLHERAWNGVAWGKRVVK